MTTEYYDRGLPGPDRKLHPASDSQQHLYNVARTRFTQAIARNMERIRVQCPDVDHAICEMQTVLRLNPSRQFKVFRPEDASLTTDADSNPAFLR